MIPVVEGHAAPPPHQAHGTHHGLAAWDACGEGEAGHNEQTPALGPDAHEISTQVNVSQRTQVFGCISASYPGLYKTCRLTVTPGKPAEGSPV